MSSLQEIADASLNTKPISKTGVSSPINSLQKIADASLQKSTPKSTTEIQTEAKPTFVGSVIRDIAKPFARFGTNLINAEQIVRGKEQTQPFSGEYLGEVKPVGQEGNFGQKLKDTLGQSLLVASNVIGGAEGGAVAKSVFKTALKKVLIRSAKEGAVLGGFQGLGSSLDKNSDVTDTVVNTVTNSLFGAGIGLATAGLSSILRHFMPEKLATKIEVKLGDLEKNKTPTEEIQMGTKASENELSTAQLDPESVANKVKDTVLKDKIPTNIDKQTEITSTPKGREEAISKPVGEGVQKESRLYQRLKDRLSEEEKAKLQGEEPMYNVAERKTQQEKAANFVIQNEELTKDILSGKELPPEGILKNDLATALEEKLLSEGKMSEWNQVAFRQSLQSTRYGQEINALRGTATPNNPAYWLNQIVSSQMQKGETKGFLNFIKEKTKGAKTRASEKIEEGVKVIKTKLDKQKMKIKEAEDLLNSLLC